jgi:hypothetical protein
VNPGDATTHSATPPGAQRGGVAVTGAELFHEDGAIDIEMTAATDDE